MHPRSASVLASSCLLAVAACSAPHAKAPVAPPSVSDGGVDLATSPPADLARAGGLDAGPPDAAPPPPDPAIAELHARADEALARLMLNFWPTLRANTTVFDWSYAHYWDAVVDAAERRGGNAYSGTLRMFFELQGQRGWTDDYYDDEDWVALALLHSYAVTHEAMYLDKAKLVYADIMKGWDETCCGVHPGGIFWHKPRDAKVTAINAGAVISGVRLYNFTKDQTYLDFAKKTYAYWSTYMVDPASGHVYDGVSTAGDVNTSWSFTYNEGLFIGAIVELYGVTHDATLLPLAHKVAGYMMKKEIETVSFGTILSDGKCSGDGQMFKGVGARYLGELYALDPSHTEYRDFLHRSSDAAWTLARDPQSGDISCDWQGPFDSATGGVQSLGSAAVGLAAAAKAIGVGAQRPAGQYEAEEGDLHAVGLEATHGGFSGWGYVAGWGADGQSLDLVVDVPAAGSYQAELRYATGDAAARVLAVNGKTAAASLAFPSTGSYDKYGTITTPLTLAAGRNTITLTYTSGSGSKGYLNLDRLQLSAK